MTAACPGTVHNNLKLKHRKWDSRAPRFRQPFCDGPRPVMNWTDFFATQSVLHRNDRPTAQAASLQSCCCFCCCRWGCSAILLLLLPPASPIRAFVITLVRHQPNTVLLLQITPTHGQPPAKSEAQLILMWGNELYSSAIYKYHFCLFLEHKDDTTKTVLKDY